MSLSTPCSTRGSYVTTADVELRWELRGDGPLIVFINSFFMPGTGWRRFTSELEQRHRLLTYDLGPQGWSDADELDFGRCVQDLHELLDTMSVDTAYLLGHSSGTQIAVAYAAAHPDRVRGLVLVGPLVNPAGGLRRREIVASWRKAYLSGGYEALFDDLWWLVHSEVTLRRAGRMGHRLMRARFAELNAGSNPLALFSMSDHHQVEFAPDFGSITAPALLITGEDDCLSTASGLRETATLLTNSELVLVPNAGHLVYLEATERFEDEVARWVSETERRRVPGARDERDHVPDRLHVTGA